MVVDTSAVVAVLLAEPDAGALAAALASATAPLMSAANYVELLLVSLSRGIAGRSEVDDTLVDAAIEIVPVSLEQARLAVTAFERFGKGRHPAPLNFGDCFAYALAKERGLPLLFKGGDDFARTDIVPAL
jgi:ribonuclease VapC